MQLELPLIEGPSSERPIKTTRRIYVNRDLKMARVDWVGFDMDYTLAIYHQEEMDRLSIACTTNKLVARGYPTWLPSLPYPLDFAIRGLLIDKHLGNVLKMNRFKIVRKGFHGLKELSRNDLRALYYERKIRHKSTRYHWIDTLYALSEAVMYATIIDAFQQRGITVKYGKLFNDIRECIDEAHRDGSILNPVMADPARFVERSEALPRMLHKLRSSGKRLFVLTNSRREYTERLLGYLLDGVLSDYPTFRHYFDAVIVFSKKPAFFELKAPLMKHEGDHLVVAKAPLERGQIYEGGNLRDLQRALGTTGNRVLYVGDHIYGDMVRSKKDSTWRTAMVIPELEAEVEAHTSCRDDNARSTELYNRRHELEEQLREHQVRLKQLERRAKAQPNGAAPDGGAPTANAGKKGASTAQGELHHAKQVLATIRRQLRSLDREGAMLKRHTDRRYHPYWGPLLKEHNEMSLFGHQVNEYACVYTSRAYNFLNYSPHQYFRSPHNLMHHELKT